MCDTRVMAACSALCSCDRVLWLSEGPLKTLATEPSMLFFLPSLWMPVQPTNDSIHSLTWKHSAPVSPALLRRSLHVRPCCPSSPPVPGHWGSQRTFHKDRQALLPPQAPSIAQLSCHVKEHLALPVGQDSFHLIMFPSPKSSSRLLLPAEEPVSPHRKAHI